MAKIKITQTRSKIGGTHRQKRTLDALGLGRISSSKEVEATPQILGVVEKVRHLVSIVEIR